LTGQPPFLRDTPVEMMIAHVRDSVRPPTDLQPELPLDIQDIVLRCLNKDPQKRFVDVENLDRELAASDCADQWNADQAAEWWQAHTIPGQDH
jgi:serine/threonine protein kinase